MEETDDCFVSRPAVARCTTLLQTGFLGEGVHMRVCGGGVGMCGWGVGVGVCGCGWVGEGDNPGCLATC